MAWWRLSAAALSAVLLAPVLGVGLLLRPRWHRGLRERLGGVAEVSGRPIWIHAASMGEVTAALRLLGEFDAFGRPVFASASTLSGRALLAKSSELVACSVAPIDHPFCVSRALARVDPSALVLVETELWPSWVAAAKRRGVPVVVVSGRISDRSFPRYLRLRPLLRRTFERLDAVGARSPLDAQRFVALGAQRDRVSVTGDLKLEPEAFSARLAPELARLVEGTRLVVAGSTHPGEDEAMLAAFEACEGAGLAFCLVLAPRHPERAVAVARLASNAGREVRLRSELGAAGQETSLRPGQVLVLDTLGELPALYAQARVAFVGGTLVPLGGHNLLEPIAAGCPLLFGPHVSNVAVVAKIAEQTGAGRVVENAAGLAAAISEVLRDPDAHERAAASALDKVKLHRGAALRSASLVGALLENVVEKG